MSTAETSVFRGNETSTVDGGGVTAASTAMATWQGYLMFAGLAIVAFGVARGSLAVRNLIYQDKVHLYTIQIVTVGLHQYKSKIN